MFRNSGLCTSIILAYTAVHGYGQARIEGWVDISAVPAADNNVLGIAYNPQADLFYVSSICAIPEDPCGVYTVNRDGEVVAGARWSDLIGQRAEPGPLSYDEGTGLLLVLTHLYVANEDRLVYVTPPEQGAVLLGGFPVTTYVRGGSGLYSDESFVWVSSYADKTITTLDHEGTFVSQVDVRAAFLLPRRGPSDLGRSFDDGYCALGHVNGVNHIMSLTNDGNINWAISTDTIPRGGALSMDVHPTERVVFLGIRNERIYIVRILEPIGDMTCNGITDAFDVEAFALALTDPAGYHAQYPNCDVSNGDINGDGTVDAFDIEPFVQALLGL